MAPHFRTFCELVEGEENKLTTFSTWTIMLGCNESNIIFQQHLCKLGQLRRSNGRNSQVFGQAMKKRPTEDAISFTVSVYIYYLSTHSVYSFLGLSGGEDPTLFHPTIPNPVHVIFPLELPQGDVSRGK